MSGTFHNTPSSKVLVTNKPRLRQVQNNNCARVMETCIVPSAPSVEIRSASFGERTGRRTGACAPAATGGVTTDGTIAAARAAGGGATSTATAAGALAGGEAG